MISHRYRCIFVHQRKSAGTSVKQMFEDATGEERGLFNDGLLDPRWHASRELIDSYYKFTVIRNPWDRFVSGWKYCRSTKGRTLEDVLRNLPRERLAGNIFARGASLGSRGHYALELLRRSLEEARYTVASRAFGFAAKRPYGQGHDFRHLTRQQCATVVRGDGSLAVDKVVFFERLEDGLREVCQDIGMTPTAVPRRKVKRLDDDYRGYFDPRSLELFQEKFGDDIATWGYDFTSGQPGSAK